MRTSIVTQGAALPGECSERLVDIEHEPLGHAGPVELHVRPLDGLRERARLRAVLFVRAPWMVRCALFDERFELSGWHGACNACAAGSPL